MSKPELKKIHVQALAVWLVYTVTGKLVLGGAVLWPEAGWGLLAAAAGGAAFGTIFLYLFSHEDFFAFAREIEKKEQKAEREWLARLAHFGRATTVVTVGVLAGPLLTALTTRLLMSKWKHKYWLTAGTCVTGAILWWLILRGGIDLIIQ